MEIKVISEKKNALLKRIEVDFLVEHQQEGGTPPRLEIRKNVASALKANPDLVFIKQVETKTGTRTAMGVAHVYDSVDQAKHIEAQYIIERQSPPEKSKEEEKETA